MGDGRSEKGACRDGTDTELLPIPGMDDRAGYIPARRNFSRKEDFLSESSWWRGSWAHLIAAAPCGKNNRIADDGWE